jgi:AbiV family abortive infection protein
MEPRALGRITELNRRTRLAVIAEGLDLLAEQVGTLGGDIDSLSKAGRRRGLTVLANHADEEAAKVLILLDVVRADRRKQKLVARQLRRFSDHLARCIYAEIAQMNPANLAEVRAIAHPMRLSHYLDGPNDIDWIFRNQVLEQREAGLYVDYVHDDERDRWVTPAEHDDVLAGPLPAGVRELVSSLHKVGVTRLRGLEIVAEVWRSHPIDDSTTWGEIESLNHSIVEKVLGEDLAGPTATDTDVGRAIESWSFPLAGIDLEEIETPIEDLRAEQERWAPS